MKTKLKIDKEVSIKYLQVDAGIRYFEEIIINGVDDENCTLTPCVENDRWKPLIAVDTGHILNWEQGKKAELYTKICDDGKYTLLDKDKNILISTESYVPICLCPKENGYGDYIIMDIDENGFIQGWVFNQDSILDIIERDFNN